MATKFPMTADEFAEAIAEYCSERIAAERRATVERIRAKAREAMVGTDSYVAISPGYVTAAQQFGAILDEEAPR